MPKVSVIVPVYNGENTIERCIDCLLAQTIDSLEIIVVNDGSDDDTLSLLSKYQSKISVYTQNRQGQGYARNFGIEKATGEYIGFVDADDTVEPEMFEKMFEVAVRDDSQIVQCGIKDITEDGAESIRYTHNAFIKIENRYDYVYNYFYKLKHTNEVCNKIIKRSFLTDNNLKFGDTYTFFSEDLRLNMEMILHLERITFIEDSFYNYYIKADGHCRKNEKERMQKIKYLFDSFFELEMEKSVADAFKAVAALTLLLYCAQASEAAIGGVMEILGSKELIEYVKASKRCKKSLKHSLLCMAIIYMPMTIKIKLVKRFYMF